MALLARPKCKCATPATAAVVRPTATNPGQYFDDYGPENGATRIVPGTHRLTPGEPPYDFADESKSIQLSGFTGDILVFDVDLRQP